MHQWQFFRAGGFAQVSLARGSDFEHLAELDQKLWVALASPVDSIEFDKATLALIDKHDDGRIRAPDVLEAVEWALARLSGADELLPGTDTLPLAAIDTGKSDGAAIAAAARRVLREMGREKETGIDLAAASGAAELLSSKPLNGDGVVPPSATGDAAIKAVIAAIVEAGLGKLDRNGEMGTAREGAESFFTNATALRYWRAECAADPRLQPAGERTGEAQAALAAVRDKIEDYFARVALVRFDPRAEEALNIEEASWLAIAARDLRIENHEARPFPLARIGAFAELPLIEGTNPAWAAELAQFRETVVQPVLGERESLAERDWGEIKARFAAYEEWLARKPTSALDAIDDTQLLELSDPSKRAALDALIDADLAVEPEYNALSDLVKLIRLRRDLAVFCRNFVNFEDFYRGKAATFQYGTLYIDQRSCDLCLKVPDAAKHVLLAGMAGMYLAYCECRRAGADKLEIVAAVTNGDSENLLVGRNGVFYDREGNDWDATITRIVDNPISVRQAFWSPYRKLARAIQEQVAKRAAAADAASTQKLQTGALGLPAAVTAPPPPAPAPAPAPGTPGAPAVPARKIDVGTVAALGVALGALGTAFGYFLRLVAEIRAWQFPLLLAGIVLLISGPSMIFAWLKLRRRNLAPMLDASGWAINTRAIVNVPFGNTLTQLAALPPGAGTVGTDRFAARGSGWGRIALLLFLLWWLFAFLADTGYLEKLVARLSGG